MATQPSDSAKQRPRPSPGDELAVIAQRAQAFTNASGAAIALSEGSEDEIVCRARSGSSAPDIGTPVRVQGSFIGLCIQTGKELRCDDAETDTRVDTIAIRALGIRSMVVTPIREDSRVNGVLAVFAPTPHAFTITHVAVLKTMADQIAALLQKERRARDESAMHPEPPVTMPKPMAVVPVPPPAPAPVVIKPAASSSAAAPAPARYSSAPAPTVEPVKPVPLAAEVAAPVPFPKKKEEKRIEPRPEPLVVKANFGTLDAVAGEQKEKSAGSKIIVVGIVAVALVGAGVFGFMRWQKSSSNSPASGSSASSPSVQTPQNALTASAVPPAGANTQPSVTSTPDSAAVSNTGASSTPGKPAAIAEKPDTKKPDPSKNSSTGQTSKPAPAPATVAIGGSPSRIASNAGQPQSTAPDVAPSLAVGGGSASNSLSSLAKPANNAPSAIVQSELVPLQVLRKVPPVYPEFARARRVSGPVVVRVMVGTDGKVTNVTFISGPLIFRDAAFDAARASQYKPALLNGKPIEQPIDIRMNFTPN